jgi:uncharacterized lipoprotein
MKTRLIHALVLTVPAIILSACGEPSENAKRQQGQTDNAQAAPHKPAKKKAGPTTDQDRIMGPDLRGWRKG